MLSEELPSHLRGRANALLGAMASVGAVLPALFTWADATPTEYDWTVPEAEDDIDDLHWLWSGESFGNNRYAQIHAFDIEFDIGVFVYLELGVSPGEIIDFWLGWFLIDIAMDDGRLGGGE